MPTHHNREYAGFTEVCFSEEEKFRLQFLALPIKLIFKASPDRSRDRVRLACDLFKGCREGDQNHLRNRGITRRLYPTTLPDRTRLPYWRRIS